MPSLDPDQRPAALGRKGLWQRGWTRLLEQSAQEQSKGKGQADFAACMQQLNEIGNWSPGPGGRDSICTQGHLTLPHLQQRDAVLLPCYFLQEFEPLLDLRDTAKVPLFLPHKGREWGWFSSGARPTEHARVKEQTSIFCYRNAQHAQLSNGLLGCAGLNPSGKGLPLGMEYKGGNFSLVTACAIFPPFYSILLALPQSES